MYPPREETIFYALFVLKIADSCPEFMVIVVLVSSISWSLCQSSACSSTLARLTAHFLSMCCVFSCPIPQVFYGRHPCPLTI